ncbi:hypothetical protein BDF14DRAFT_1994489 [Spinellus fusiger]|nr:hypothetical protein BDF14DRAFT_1994489 [Spinellus fusiger]
MPNKSKKIRNVLPAWKRATKAYRHYAKNINDEKPFPISLNQMIKFIKFKRETNSYKSLRWYMDAFKHNPTHSILWNTYMRNNPSLIQLLDQYKKEDLLLNRGKSQPPNKYNPYCLNINPRPRSHPLALPPHKLNPSNKPSQMVVEDLDHYTPPVVECSDKKFNIPLPVVVISLSEGLQRISQLRNATTKPLKLAIRNPGRLTEDSTISQPDTNHTVGWKDKLL